MSEVFWSNSAYPEPFSDSHVLNIFRMCPTMTPLWISMLMRPMGSPWRDTSIREPAMPLRPGAGTSLPTTYVRGDRQLHCCLCQYITKRVFNLCFSNSWVSGLITDSCCHVLLQTLVFNSKKSAGVSEEIQGKVFFFSASLKRCSPLTVWSQTEEQDSFEHKHAQSDLHVCAVSFRTSLPLWWRTCVSAQSSPAVKMREDSALKWSLHRSEFAWVRISMN